MLATHSKHVRCFLIATLLTMPVVAIAADDVRYISDKLYVPLRAEQNDDAQIVNSGLPSGTTLKLVKEESSSGYSLVETKNGTQGWIRSRYLVKEPTSAIKLAEMEKKLSASTSKNEADLINDIEALKLENKKLSDQLTNSERQFDELKKASGNVAHITEQNHELIEKNQLLQSKVDSLGAVKEKYQNNSNMDQFMYGGLLVIATLIVSFLIDSIRKRRAYSSWG
jgi:SH3 domain protein